MADAGRPCHGYPTTMATFHEQRTTSQRPSFWTRYRWLIVAVVAIAIAVAVVLVIAYSGGGGGGGAGGGGGGY